MMNFVSEMMIFCIKNDEFPDASEMRTESTFDGASLTMEAPPTVIAPAPVMMMMLPLPLPLAGMVPVSKDDGFCIKNEELCIKNGEFCISNEELYRCQCRSPSLAWSRWTSSEWLSRRMTPRF